VILRYALLGLLAAEPASGFDLLRRFSRTAGYAWSAHHSQIYPELARCLGDRLIEEIGAGPRGKRIYRTTELGLQTLRAWLSDPSIDRTVRSEPTLRSFFTWAMGDAAAAEFYRREADYHREALRGLEQIAAEFPDDWAVALNAKQKSGRMTLERGLRLHTALAEWADWAAEHAAERSAVARVPGAASEHDRQ
jgi:DNA-binding PadR family transcriptional regulator